MAVRSLITHQARLVGLLISNVVARTGAGVMDAIATRAHERGYAVVLSRLPDHGDRQAELLNRLMQYRVDGVIAHVDLVGADLPTKQLASRRFSLVLSNVPGAHEVFGSISLDYEDATSPIAGHLLEHCPATHRQHRRSAGRHRAHAPRFPGGFTNALAAAGATDCKDTTV